MSPEFIEADDFESTQTLPSSAVSGNRCRAGCYWRTGGTGPPSGAGGLGIVRLYGIRFLRAAATRQPLRRTIRSCSADPCSQSLRTNILEGPFDSLHLVLRGRNDRRRVVLR